MIDGFPLFFFLPLVVHALAGLSTGATGIMAFRAPKRRERHPRWGVRYLWAYTVVFLTATILSAMHPEVDPYLFFLGLIGYGFALIGYGARRFRREPWLMRMLGKQWVVVHIVGMIGSYVVLWTAFYVDNAHLIPLLNQLPLLTFWVLPTVIGLPFIVLSIARFAPNMATSGIRPGMERKEETV
jgi:H+/Cl- antiporter ClcA